MRHDPVDGDVRAELEAHIELRARDNIRAGMAPRVAWAEARRVFGDLDRIGATCSWIRRGGRGDGGGRLIGLILFLVTTLAAVDRLRAPELAGNPGMRAFLMVAALVVTLLVFGVTICCLSATATRHRVG